MLLPDSIKERAHILTEEPDVDFCYGIASIRDENGVETGTIGNNVWLGSCVMVLKGVTISDNLVVGAMSVVTKSIPTNSLAAGIPAKVIRSIV